MRTKGARRLVVDAPETDETDETENRRFFVTTILIMSIRPCASYICEKRKIHVTKITNRDIGFFSRCTRCYLTSRCCLTWSLSLNREHSMVARRKDESCESQDSQISRFGRTRAWDFDGSRSDQTRDEREPLVSPPETDCGADDTIDVHSTSK